MAAIDFDSILSSKPFRFLVGPHKTEFFIHASLAASQSSVIDSLVNGSMKEATDGCTVWEDVDEDTFVRFGQYVYTGDYEGSAACAPEAVPEPLPQNSDGSSESLSPTAHRVVRSDTGELGAAKAALEEAVPEDPVPEADDFWDSLPTTRKMDKKKKRAFWRSEREVDDPVAVESPPTVPHTMKNAWDSFQKKRSYECGVAGIHFCSTNKDSKREYRGVFLSHARVHMMADYYDMPTLAQLALHKLHRILCQFTLHNERICDVVALLRYCYEEDERPLLRELVSAYAACHAKRLWTSHEFRELFAAHGELSHAVMGNIMAKIQ
ncbi:hypothetical protein LLEC1_01413 [Akanthomyces lecanii]|uniref:BTB domain-containing protein n=1 Tax=Cordyceps confragosa TaxID=2714763 RepID=A0A179IV79_CORDF|nr:hypothetical protein LLEC1_01413 [Akanthomyces lecanii]